ncbi:hypothetical protein GCM10009127_15740 [Alteraurantiacibacter aestuarii]|uniref:Uncharacterized protein n=1 Tax=Alteraurantiacibacter aestuarii TaxID=650004 RepID=A0A844ZLE5_9SPHN|nr:hypothetical protein [Alteraurantiacibacter aestuarii]MXO87840.1 hypothetical protein [Alteraurantiacibacter aestuarii]
MTDNLYLLWFDNPEGLPSGFDFHGDAQALADGMWLVRSDLTRSKLYHRAKWQLPDDAPLLLAPLADDRDGWPKFKGLEVGALKWLRQGET